MVDQSQLSVLYATNGLTDAERDIMEFIANNMEDAISMGANGIARACYTSSTSVTRLAKKLGYKNSRDMLFAFEHLSHTPSGFSASRNGSYLRYRPHDLNRLFDVLSRKGCIGMAGQGYSALVTTYMERKLMAFGCQVIQQNDLEPHTILKNFGAQLDAYLLVTKSGNTRAILDTAEECHNVGVPVIGITGNSNSALRQYADSLFVIQDDAPFDIENTEPNYFFGYCILAFEEILGTFLARSDQQGVSEES